MSRMSEAQYELMKDCRDKKITARSARHTRTHCGKSGAVKFPSDYLSAKERRKLSGECKSYRMNDPMTWAEFMAMPDDLKKDYIKALRQKYNVPDFELAKMFGVSQCTVSNYLRQIGLGLGKNGRKRTWNSDGFYAWRDGVKVKDVLCTKDESAARMAEHTPPTKEGLAKFAVDVDATKTVKFPHGGSYDIPIMTVAPYIVPDNGTLTFEGDARSVLRSLHDILRDQHVRLSVQWSVVDKPGEPDPTMLDTDALKKAGTIIDYAILNEQRKERIGTKG